MPDTVPKALHKFQYPTPKKYQYVPHTWTHPVYGQKVQHALPPETLPILDKKRIKHVQLVTGTFGYHYKAINLTIIVEVNKITS